MNKYLLTKDNVKYLGRGLYMNDMLWCTWSATGAEFVTDGNEIKITIVGDEAASNDEFKDDRARIAVYVDGSRVIDKMIDKDITVLEVQAGDGTHTVKVLKLSESAMSTFAIRSIETDGTVKPAALKDKYIEIIGDSITCGYGIDDENPEHHFVTATEDVTGSYSLMTVDLLDWDYSIVSLSGYGIISGYTDDITKIRDDQLLPDFYETMGYAKTLFNGIDASKVSWDFRSERPTDMIVINLGTNDESYCMDDKERQNIYRDRYVEFLKKVRSCHPTGNILCVLGIMGDKLCPSLDEAVEAYKKATGDMAVSTLMFGVQLEEDGRTADYHVTRRTNTKMAKRIVEEINKLLG